MSELSPETRAFLDVAARGDGPSDEDRARIRHKLAVELGAAALATTTLAVAAHATATTTSLSAAATSVAVGKASAGAGMGLLGKIAIAAALAGAVSTTAVVVVQSNQSEARKAASAKQVAIKRDHLQERASEHANQVVEPPSAAAVPSVAAALDPVPSIAQLEATPVALPEVVKVRHERASAKASAPEPEPEQRAGNMAEELELLHKAQTALREGRTADALSISADHAARFPHGALHEERAAVEMLAHCAEGSASTTQLTSFLQTTPESPLKERVRQACKVEP